MILISDKYVSISKIKFYFLIIIKSIYYFVHGYVESTSSCYQMFGYKWTTEFWVRLDHLITSLFCYESVWVPIYLIPNKHIFFIDLQKKVHEFDEINIIIKCLLYANQNHLNHK